mgnify:CR=1 FL=1
MCASRSSFNVLQRVSVRGGNGLGLSVKQIKKNTIDTQALIRRLREMGRGETVARSRSLRKVRKIDDVNGEQVRWRRGAVKGERQGKGTGRGW